MLYRKSIVSSLHFVAHYLLCLTLLPYVQWFADNITVLDWPGNSPDLNPIENLWSQHSRPEKTALLLHAATRRFAAGNGHLNDATFRRIAADTPDHVQRIGMTRQQRSPGHAKKHRHRFLFRSHRGVPKSIQRRRHP